MSFPNERLRRSFERFRPHGTRARYQQGCRCFECRRVCAEYQRNRVAKHKAGEPSNHIVSAAGARNHLLKLQKYRVGLGTVEELTGIAKPVLGRIRSGRQAHLREANERLILSVTKDARRDFMRVPSVRTRGLAERLNREGFTYQEIARRAGVAKGSLMPRKSFVYARTEMRVEKFYNKIMAA